MRLLAGIDGGGTRTRLALVHEDGTLLGYAEGGPCGFTDIGLDRARQALGALWDEAWRSAGAAPRPADALFLGMGSVLSEADERTTCALTADLELARPWNVRASNDAWAALAGGLAGRPGILLIAGTGSACLGRNECRETWRAGGWGYLLDDVGSAYALGQAALIAATRDADGRGAPTALTTLVRQALGLSDLTEIFRKLHHDGVSRADVAALAPRVVAHAEAGDRVAGRILDQGVEGLIEMVATVARKLRLSRPELALTGGLITHAASFRALFCERLTRAVPHFTLAGAGFAPVFGAVMRALESATGALPDASFLDNLRRSTARLEADP
jgi:N-acetylglucosamine kinase-like BadF-type ATPase